MTTNSYFAQSYTGNGFYFESLDEYREKMGKANFEEVEIQLIDGNAKLFEAAGITQATIDVWFQELEDVADDDEAIRIQYLLDIGLDLQDAIERHEEVHIWRGTAEDYAAELIEETIDLSTLGNLQHYIAYEAIARDMNFNSEITEIERGIWITNCLDF